MDKRAIGTLFILFFFILASVGIYYLHNQMLQKEVYVSSVVGRVQPAGENLGLIISYFYSSANPFVYKQGDTFFAILYVTGNGTLQSLAVNTIGFNASIVTPSLPLKINNYSEPTVVVLGISVLKCCYRGIVSLTLNGD